MLFDVYYNETMPTMTDELFEPALDGPTLRDAEEMEQYREWIELSHAGS